MAAQKRNVAILAAIIAAIGVVVAASVTGFFGLTKKDGGTSQGNDNSGNCQITGNNNNCGAGGLGNTQPKPGPEPSAPEQSDPPTTFPSRS